MTTILAPLRRQLERAALQAWAIAANGATKALEALVVHEPSPYSHMDNTLGAWHAGKVLAANPQFAEIAQSEDELRQAVALPACPWTYLWFVKVTRASRSGFENNPDRDGLVTVWTLTLFLTEA